jgi:hypothetical protein
MTRPATASSMESSPLLLLLDELLAEPGGGAESE